MHELWMASRVGGLTGATMFATSNLNVEEGRVSVAVAVTVMVFVSGVVWWLSSRFQSIADSQREMSARLSKIEAELTARNEADDRQ